MDPRVLAAKTITDVINTKTSLNVILPKYKEMCAKKDQALLQALCYGVFRFYPTLIFFTQQLLQKPLKQKDNDILNLILVGLYQLVWMRIPTHAAIKETVDGATHLGKIWAKSLVNAILRNYERQSESLNFALHQNEQALSAHPAWLLKKIQSAWPNHWSEIINANNTFPPLTLRVNFKRITRELLLENFAKMGIEARPSLNTPTAIKLAVPKDIPLLPGFNEGFFSVQDEASQFVPRLLELTSNLRILDAASAPGGKLCHILEQPFEYQEAIALDISKERTRLIVDNLKRLHLTAKILVSEAQQTESWWDGILFDRILLDAPCSATGVIRRHPDIKLTRSLKDIKQLTTQQFNMLTALWPLLNKGGILLYSTCSILPEENQEIIAKFLSLHKDAILLPIHLPFGLTLPIGHQLLPGQNDTDGFYYARIGKMK